MEENITKRRANTVTIAVVGQNIQKITGELSKVTGADSTLTTEYNFKAASLNEKPEADLIVFAADSDDPENNKHFQSVQKTGNAVFVQYKNDPVQELTDVIHELEDAFKLNFSVADYARIHSKGIPVKKIADELSIFQNGITKVVLHNPATIGNGIYPLQKLDAIEYADFFDSKKNNYRLKKFVPASGAASRMFKFLCEFAAEYDPEKESINAYINRNKDSALKVFLVGLDKFPFFKDVMEEIKKDPEYSEWSKDLRYYNFIKTLLAPGKFNYANKPKGILPFHQYDDFIATPVYEHLKECAAYASSNGEAHVHFTISEDHLDHFLDCVKDVKEKVEQETGVKLHFSFSYQHKETDTIAVDVNNVPFRNSDGSLLFRPGGHGALIENLNNLDADIVCIKNIDNVSHNNIKVISLYKKALLGIVIKLKEQVCQYLEMLDNPEVSEADVTGILQFAQEKLFISVSRDVAKFTLSHKIEYTRDLLNRPIRICGMVKNEGEPGGGPFWVKDSNGRTSLQIVESSQIDLDNKTQNQIFSASTHFNPVDLVCTLKNYKGEPFNLKNYIDPTTGFIVQKNKMGKKVKSYELPGLWNGAMAEWITVFVEVPLETFNPFKTVNDLLKPAHQPQ
jgi:hypothetical protein